MDNPKDKRTPPDVVIDMDASGPEEGRPAFNSRFSANSTIYEKPAASEDAQTMLEVLKKMNARFEQQELDDKRRHQIDRCKTLASSYIIVSVFIASIGVGLLSYAHDNTSTGDSSSSVASTTNVTSAITIPSSTSDVTSDVVAFGDSCSSSVFTIASSFFIVSIFYAFFSTLVSLYGTFELGIGWWKALWIGVTDVEDLESGTQEKINAFLSRLYSAKLLLNISIWALIIGLYFVAFCVMSLTAFGLQWAFAAIAFIFVARATIIRSIINVGLAIRWIFRGLFCCTWGWK